MANRWRFSYLCSQSRSGCDIPKLSVFFETLLSVFRVQNANLADCSASCQCVSAHAQQRQHIRLYVQIKVVMTIMKQKQHFEFACTKGLLLFHWSMRYFYNNVTARGLETRIFSGRKSNLICNSSHDL